MLLTDPLDERAVAVLRLVRRGYQEPSRHSDERWPTWQWVRWKADRQGIDAEAVLRRLPTWQYHYKAYQADDLGGSLDPGRTIALTVRGLAAVGDNDLVPVFLAALAVAEEHQAEVEPDPHEPSKLRMSGDLLTCRVEDRTGRRPLQPSVVRSLLLREPPTWNSHDPTPRWEWDLTRAPLWRFRGVQTVEDYLERLDDYIGVRPPAAAATVVPPLALVDALDHLDAEWTLRTGHRLLQPQRLARPAQLSQPVVSGAEFEAACSAFDDLLKQIQPLPAPSTVNQGKLAQLASRLDELLPPDAAARAADAIAVLRAVNALRIGQQHSGTKPYQRQQDARRDLGLAEPPDDWSGDWQRIQHAVLDALRTLRNEISAASAAAP